MPKMNAPLYSLNGGEVSDEALGRLDLERMQFAGSEYINALPKVVGPMGLRSGLEYLVDIPFGNSEMLEYNYSGGALFVPIVSDGEIRIFKDDAFITRADVDTEITSGSFVDFTGWTDASSGTASADASGNLLRLEGGPFDRASAKQTVSVVLADRGVEHGLRINVEHGPLYVTLGSTAGDDDLISAAVLEDGDHSIAFTPTTANVYLELYTENNRRVRVKSCKIDTAGVLVLESPYTVDDIQNLRYTQSIDTIFVACSGFQQREIQRRGDSSWGIQRYKVNDGPFVFYNGIVRLTPTVYEGNGFLTSSSPIFKLSMVGRLYRLTQSGQTVLTNFNAEDQQGEYIRVTGVDDARKITYAVSGTFVGTWVLQVATSDGSDTPTGWTDVATGTAATSTTYTDTDDNVIKYFRFIVEVGGYTSGVVETSLAYAGGSQDGVCRITNVQSTTEANMEVLERFYSLNSTSQWDHSTWSDYDGWPVAVTEFSGRIIWSKVDTGYGTVSDAYYSFDDTIEGDSAPIVRSFNSGGHSGPYWLLGLQRLLAGSDVSEVSVRSSAFDEPLTASNWYPLTASTQGCYDIRPVKTDTDGIYVAADGASLHSLTWDAQAQDYTSSDLTILNQNIFEGASVVSIAVQRKPDTIVWIVLSDGTARALTYQPKENVIAWWRLATDGFIRRVAVSKGLSQDNVIFTVGRDSTRRLERLADPRGCVGGQLNCLADSFKKFELDTPQTTFAVPHLDGRDVTVWADGAAIHNQDNLYTVASGVVTLSVAASNVVIGLPYTGVYHSTKLAYGAALGTALFQVKRVSALGLYFVKTILDGVRVGRDADNLFAFTTTKNDAPIVPGALQATFDGQMQSFSGDWNTDSRIYIEMKSPYPCTVAGLAMQVKTNDAG